MSYGTNSFWEIYFFGLQPICGTVVVATAFAVFIAGMRDHAERKPLWVGTIFGVVLLGLCTGEWFSDMYWSDYNEGRRGYVQQSTLLPFHRARMMFMAQAGLAVTFGLGLLWWPVRPKDEG